MAAIVADLKGVLHMCRFVAYKGNETRMVDLLMHAENSLVTQSYGAKKRYKSVNGDGFGIAWYPTYDDPVPGVFTSIMPAWSDRNLYRLSEKIYSACFFAHVRDATLGFPITEFNCHPFRYKRFLFMHNGRVGEFDKIKRRLRESLSDELYNFIEGNTDSELVFALILQHLSLHGEDPTLEQLVAAVNHVFHDLLIWEQEFKVKETTFLNIALTDGKNMVATRYTSNLKDQAASLFVSSGMYQQEKDNIRIYGTRHPQKETVIIASEPLTRCREDWQKVERNQIVTVDENNHLSIENMQLA